MRPEDRKTYLSLALRRVRAGSGSGAAVLRERTTAYGTPDLRCLEGRVRFIIVGGLATRLYMPERMTLDVDVLVRRGDGARAEEALKDTGASKEGPLAIGGSTWRMPDGRVVDLIALDEPWVEDALLHAVRGEGGLPFIALPYLVLMKLAAGRLQDLADAGRMLGAADDEAIGAVREIVVRYCPEDADDLESIIRMGRIEYGSSGAVAQGAGGDRAGQRWMGGEEGEAGGVDAVAHASGEKRRRR